MDQIAVLEEINDDLKAEITTWSELKQDQIMDKVAAMQAGWTSWLHAYGITTGHGRLTFQGKALVDQLAAEAAASTD